MNPDSAVSSASVKRKDCATTVPTPARKRKKN